MNDATKGLIRLAAAWVAGVLILKLTTLSDRIGDSTLIPPGAKAVLADALELLFAAVYYWCIRVGQRRWAVLGWLLGYPGSPVYVQPAEEEEAKERIGELAA